jgi:hypothetical protein
MTKYLVYTHSAKPPINIKIGIWYSLDELKSRFAIEYIKEFFSPSNFAWEDLNEKKSNDIKKEIK